MSDRLPSRCLTRREETALSLVCILVIYLHVTHLFLLKGEKTPLCVSCDELLSLEHILLFCSDLIVIIKKYFNVDSLKVLFEEISSDIILSYLKEINIV